MFRTDLLKTTRFRQTAALASVFALSTLLLLGGISWRAASGEARRIDALVAEEAETMASQPLDTLRVTVDNRINGDINRLHYAGLFDRDGRRLAGNLSRPPADLPLGGWVRPAACPTLAGEPPTPQLQACRAVARLRPDGVLLVIARKGEDYAPLRAEILAAIEYGLTPAILLALVAGAVMGWHLQQRAKAAHLAAERISQGDLNLRLPVRGGRDELDLLSDGVNDMIDGLARLLDDTKATSQEIAHDLRTPLTRVRLRLERARRSTGTREDLEDAIDTAVDGLDRALAIMSALLRARELEADRRRAGFGRVDLQEVIETIFDFYEPIAEEKNILLRLEKRPVQPIVGDRDLLIEAIGNLVHNAIKFTPPGGIVTLSLILAQERPVIRVADNGPGIPPQERAVAFTRFYRSPQQAALEGYGIGLNLVAAISKLHDIEIALNDNNPGCVIDLRFDGQRDWSQVGGSGG
ncbi:MAG TPA: HAMP domain-containing sensor histidine kinase [Aliidongia sp.]|nr:HAMP domain-containing sensor histidine kinase [Aliidongia sp.]